MNSSGTIFVAMPVAVALNVGTALLVVWVLFAQPVWLFGATRMLELLIFLGLVALGCLVGWLLVVGVRQVAVHIQSKRSKESTKEWFERMELERARRKRRHVGMRSLIWQRLVAFKHKLCPLIKVVEKVP